MDEKLHIMHHLYGEQADPADLRRLLEDEALREEYEALRAVKVTLDQRPRPRPDPQVIDRIVAAAATPQRAGLLRPRPDRAARPGRAFRRFRAVGAVSAALAVLLAIGIGLDAFQSVVPTTPQADTAFEAPAAEGVDALAREAPAPVGARPPEAVPLEENRAARSDAPAPAEPEAALLVGALEDKAEETVPSWNEADDLLRVHRGIEMIRARSLDLTWDESAVMSLDSLPTEPDAADGLEAAGARRTRDNQ